MIYFDNAASTRPRKEVVEAEITAMSEEYANPSSSHEFGLKAAKKVKQAKEILAKFLEVKTESVYFTSGGTHGNNVAIQGIIKANARKKRHLVTTKIEHPSVYEIFREYEKSGFEISYADVDSHGRVDKSKLLELIREDTVLVSIGAVNSETGVIQNIEEISKLIKEKNKDTFFHTDFVQGFGHLKLNMKKCSIDALTVSSHKIYGPRGTGAVYVSEKVRVEPLMFGSGPESPVIPGTLNYPGIIAFSEAVKIAEKNFIEENKHIRDIRDYFLLLVKKETEAIRVNSPEGEGSVPHILNISFKGVKGEVLLHFLSMNQIYASTGSACNSKKSNSRVLSSLGIGREEIEGGMRFSFSIFNTREEVEKAAKILGESVKSIRMMR